MRVALAVAALSLAGCDARLDNLWHLERINGKDAMAAGTSVSFRKLVVNGVFYASGLDCRSYSAEFKTAGGWLELTSPRRLDGEPRACSDETERAEDAESEQVWLILESGPVRYDIAGSTLKLWAEDGRSAEFVTFRD